MFVCDIGCPRSPGKRTRKNTTPGAAVRVTPDKLQNGSDCLSPGPRGSWSASSSAVRRATPTHEYNLSLSEMRHYKDEDTMVLILSQNNTPAEEAEYPVPMEHDTSELLDAEDDDTLAGYAEVASRLVRPSPLQLPMDEDDTRGAARRLFYDDDVRHEEFSNHTYEADSPGTNGATRHDHPKGATHSHGSPRDASGFFDTSQASNADPEWSPADPIVHDQPWMADGQDAIQNDHTAGTNGSARHNDRNGNRSPSSRAGRSAAAETSQSRGRAFSPSGPGGRAWPKVHNGSIHRSPRAHNGASADDGDIPKAFYHPSTSGPVRVSNGAGPASLREARSEQRRAAGRDMRGVSPPAGAPAPDMPEDVPPKDEPQPPTDAEPRGFFDQRQGNVSNDATPAVSGVESIPTDVQPSLDARHGEPVDSADVLPNVNTDYPAAPVDAPPDPYSPADVRPFFSSQPPAGVSNPVLRYQSEEDDIPDPEESFFTVNPTLPSGYKASIPAHYPRRPVPKPPPGIKRSTDSSRKDVLETEFPDTPPSPRQKREQHASTEAEERSLSEAVAAEDPRNGSDKILESQDDHASRSFARAVSHSSLPSAMPEHSVRRGASSQRNSAMRRSSRRDAHMQTRIANLDTSNLSHYSLPTLQRLAKDMGLSNYSRLSKSELVVQLVAEIILANMHLGWSVPEVAHGHLDEEEDAEGHAVSDTADHSVRQHVPLQSGSQRSRSPSPGTVYRFGGSYDSEDERDAGSDVEVEPEVSPEAVQRGQDLFSRLKQWLPKLGRGPAGSSGAVVAEGHGGGPSHAPKRTVRMGSGEVALGGENVEQDFECLSALSMSQLQELCEDLGVDGWPRMRKYEMVGALLMDVYGLQH
eukprot:jgi/Ulvmu1/8041/UM004_0278.1